MHPGGRRGPQRHHPPPDAHIAALRDANWRAIRMRGCLAKMPALGGSHVGVSHEAASCSACDTPRAIIAQGVPKGSLGACLCRGWRPESRRWADWTVPRPRGPRGTFLNQRGRVPCVPQSTLPPPKSPFQRLLCIHTAVPAGRLPLRPRVPVLALQGGSRLLLLWPLPAAARASPRGPEHTSSERACSTQGALEAR